MNENIEYPQTSEDEIDLVELFREVWKGRKLIYVCCGIAVVLALVVGFSIPKEYTTTATLASESADGKSLGNLGALASMAGVNPGSNGGTDAVLPELYPDVVSSVPFMVGLFDVQVTSLDGDMQTDVYNYVFEELRSPWWSAVAAAPFKLLGWFMSLFRDEEPSGDGTRDPFHLNKDEMSVVRSLRDRISVSVDKKTSVVTISVTMQDPMISATLTDVVMRDLQDYVSEYRTNKARHDLEFTQSLFDEAQRNYYASQQAYAGYMDSNQNIALRSARIEQERLQNEMSLSYNLYNQMAQQLQLAKAKVQESTPVYTVLQPAIVPLKASKPSKMMILAGFVFLAAAGAAAWILFGRKLLAGFREEK